MVRALPTAAVLAATLASVACGGDAFTAGPEGTDAGAMRDGTSPMDTGPSEASPVDAFSEPPPTCGTGYACVPAVPSGWQGPLEVYAGTAPPPTCTSGFAQSIGANDVLQAPAATCGCSCGPSSITCSAPAIDFYDGMTCSATPLVCASLGLSPNSCVTVNELTKCAATYLDISVPDGTSAMSACAPQPVKNVPPYTWGTQARGCVSTVAPAQVNCASGEICAPAPGAGFAAKLCVSHAGDVLCPGGGYGVKHTYFTSVADTRSCSDCTCSAPNGGSCSFALDVYQSSNGSCSGGAVTFAPGDKCAGVNQPGDFRLTETSVAGTCGPSTSSPTGLAVPAGAVTVCCPQ